ncbi:hypothetical protein [Yoonia sp. MH D7]
MFCILRGKIGAEDCGEGRAFVAAMELIAGSLSYDVDVELGGVLHRMTALLWTAIYVNRQKRRATCAVRLRDV